MVYLKQWAWRTFFCVYYPCFFVRNKASCQDLWNSWLIFLSYQQISSFVLKTRIGVAPNLDVIRQYFTEQYAVDTSKMNIPQYLLYMSKRDCNFRKLIDTINSCCEETLDVQYYPVNLFEVKFMKNL